MKREMFVWCIFLGLAGISQQLIAADASGTAKTDDKPKVGVENTNGGGGVLDGFKFGMGIGFENYKSGYVNEAETVGTNRVVRVTDSQDRKPSLWLETHYLWDGAARSIGFTHSAPGFYVGARVLGPGSDTFDAFSLGLMWAFKRTALGQAKPASSGDQVSESINIGIGPVWHRTRKLASGIKEGDPLPADYQDIKYDRRDETSWMLMISVGF